VGKKGSPIGKRCLPGLQMISNLQAVQNYILRKFKDIKEGSWTDGGKTRIDSPGFLFRNNHRSFSIFLPLVFLNPFMPEIPFGKKDLPMGKGFAQWLFNDSTFASAQPALLNAIDPAGIFSFLKTLLWKKTKPTIHAVNSLERLSAVWPLSVYLL
jgi:hypothetical protein